LLLAISLGVIRLLSISGAQVRVLVRPPLSPLRTCRSGEGVEIAAIWPGFAVGNGSRDYDHSPLGERNCQTISMARFGDPVRFGTPSLNEKRQVLSIGRGRQSACESLHLRRRYSSKDAELTSASQTPTPPRSPDRRIVRRQLAVDPTSASIVRHGWRADAEVGWREGPLRAHCGHPSRSVRSREADNSVPARSGVDGWNPVIGRLWQLTSGRLPN
jgi:hypothetical protein